MIRFGRYGAGAGAIPIALLTGNGHAGQQPGDSARFQFHVGPKQLNGPVH
jgi:hypothetical protein